MPRIALLLQYLGSGFHGWQRQDNGSSIQQTLEETIAPICGHPVVIHGAGRTDTGVHASGQVAHFHTDSPIPADRWSKVLNSRLPPAICILESVLVDDRWHAQFSAKWRRYRYTILNSPVPSVFWRSFSWHYYYADLDADLMHQALQPMLGEQDLWALQRSGSLRAHSRLTIQSAKCWRAGDMVFMEMQASGFLYGMIRLLMGQLVAVGRCQMSIDQFTQIWQSKNRSAVKYAAPPQGLCLIGVGYDPYPFQIVPPIPFSLADVDNCK
jgi:tRNA pseudouridine38-40 synthase